MQKNIKQIQGNTGWAREIIPKSLSGGHFSKISSFRRVQRGMKLGFNIDHLVL